MLEQRNLEKVPIAAPVPLSCPRIRKGLQREADCKEDITNLNCKSVPGGQVFVYRRDSCWCEKVVVGLRTALKILRRMWMSGHNLALQKLLPGIVALTAIRFLFELRSP